MRTFTRMSLAAVVLLSAAAAPAQPVFFSTGAPDGRLATATTQAGNGFIEHETGDDFFLTHNSRLTNASFFGLLPTGFGVGDVSGLTVEIYRIFPLDSDVGRTSGPPTFSTSQVPTRVNSPSDVELLGRDLGAGDLTFSATNLGSFSVLNTVVNGINPTPANITGGEGPLTGDEFRFDVTFTNPIDLAAGHYFFVPQVLLTGSTTPFLWLSAARPIVGGTPFPAGVTDLQSWIRDAHLDPDWLRIGTDIIGPPANGGPAPTFNAAFSLSGNQTPEPSTLALLAGGLALVGWMGRRSRRT